MFGWTKGDHKQFERTIIREYREMLERLRNSGAVPDGFEVDEPASLPKIAVRLLTDHFLLTDRAKKELKNLRHFS